MTRNQAPPARSEDPHGFPPAGPANPCETPTALTLPLADSTRNDSDVAGWKTRPPDSGLGLQA